VDRFFRKQKITICEERRKHTRMVRYAHLTGEVSVDWMQSLVYQWSGVVSIGGDEICVYGWARKGLTPNEWSDDTG